MLPLWFLNSVNRYISKIIVSKYTTYTGLRNLEISQRFCSLNIKNIEQNKITGEMVFFPVKYSFIGLKISQKCVKHRSYISTS